MSEINGSIIRGMQDSTQESENKNIVANNNKISLDNSTSNEMTTKESQVDIVQIDWKDTGSDLASLNVNLPITLVDAIDHYAEEMGIDRTTAIGLLCRLQLDRYRYRYYDDDGNEVKFDK